MWNVKFCLCGVFLSPTQTYCSSLGFFHDLFLSHMYIFNVSVWILDPVPINYENLADQTTVDEHRSMYPLQASFKFLPCVRLMWTPCLMWKGWSTKHLNVLKSSGRLISKLSLITKAACWNHRAWGIEVTAIATSKTSRIYRNYGYCLLCRCAASNMLWRSQKATERTCRDAISPRYSQHAGDSDNKRHVEFGTAMGDVCNQC